MEHTKEIKTYKMSLQRVYMNAAVVNFYVAYFTVPVVRCFGHMLFFKMMKILLILKNKWNLKGN